MGLSSVPRPHNIAPHPPPRPTPHTPPAVPAPQRAMSSGEDMLRAVLKPHMGEDGPTSASGLLGGGAEAATPPAVRWFLADRIATLREVDLYWWWWWDVCVCGGGVVGCGGVGVGGRLCGSAPCPPQMRTPGGGGVACCHATR